jgi:hypothetical protein
VSTDSFINRLVFIVPGELSPTSPYPNWDYFLIGGRAGRHAEAFSKIS